VNPCMRLVKRMDCFLLDSADASFVGTENPLRRSSST
jgi:hypothetical protein